MLPIIQSLWVGNALSTMEKLCMKSFLENGHPFHLYVYNDIKNIPAGVTVKDAAAIVPPEKIFKYKDHDSYAGFSNIFRYKLLLEKGGFWVDTDLICLMPFQPSLKTEYIFSSQHLRQNNASNANKPYKVNCGTIMAPAGSSVMEYCYNVSIDRDPAQLTWGEIGPNLMGKAVDKFGLQNFVVKPRTFCPIPFWNWKLLINDLSIKNGLEDIMSILMYEARGIHLWNEYWRRDGIDKNSVFPPNSIYEKLKRLYAVT